MKAVILAGGNGTRLYPLTKVTNKCLLPIYNKPMIYYPIQNLVDSGIKDILLVCGGNAAGEFLRILGNGEDFGLKHLHYTYQKAASGIADALGLAEEWANEEPIVVMLADNILEKPFGASVEEFEKNPVGARIFGTTVEHPEWYGVIEKDDAGNVLNIVEKPKEPKSSTIAIGLYMYDNTVWDFIRQLKPSARGELEITDVNNYYVKSGTLKMHQVDGWWGDAGESFEAYMSVNCKMHELTIQAKNL